MEQCADLHALYSASCHAPRLCGGRGPGGESLSSVPSADASRRCSGGSCPSDSSQSTETSLIRETFPSSCPRKWMTQGFLACWQMAERTQAAALLSAAASPAASKAVRTPTFSIVRYFVTPCKETRRVGLTCFLFAFLAAFLSALLCFSWLEHGQN